MNPKNLLLAHLPREVSGRINTDLELVSLANGKVIHRPGEPIRELYFPETCMISVTVRMGDGRTVETDPGNDRANLAERGMQSST